LVAAGASSPISSNDIISDSYSIQLVATGPNKFKEYWFWNGLTKTWGQAMAEHFADTPSHGIIPFTTSTNQYRTPTLSGSIALNQMYGFPTGSQVIDGGSTTWQQVATSSSYQCNWDFHISIVYRIQYQDGSGGWRTYGTFIGMDNPSSPLPGTGYRQGGYYSFSTTTQNGWFNCPKSDPRTFRFGSGQGSSTLLPPGTAGRSLTPVASGTIGLITQEEPFGCSSSGNPYRFDLWAENSSSGGPPNSNYNNPSYPDNDSLVRPGDAINCYPANSPLFDSGSAARPVILNRPFRSVGELGYVFRNMPWKTLDFFSAYSADAPLLDLFTLNGNQPVLAGRLDPNTRQSGVLQAVISGATQASGSGGTTVTPQNAAALASAIVTHSQAQPFTNRADLVTGLMSDGTFAKTLAGVTTTKTEQEAVIRALADCSNTRTWNLLIDLVVQVGKYPAPASSLGQFLVEGERHYWLHVAIDRYTGKVIDKQLEVVRE
jgi:hypothetical protein